MAFLLFDYTSSAMKNTVYNFRLRHVVWEEPDLLSKKKTSSRTCNQARSTNSEKKNNFRRHFRKH